LDIGTNLDLCQSVDVPKVKTGVAELPLSNDRSSDHAKTGHIVELQLTPNPAYD
jgi:hypothetical protein